MTVGIVGTGTMGIGIAQVAATAGCRVRIFDLVSSSLEKAKPGIEKSLDSLVAKGKLAQEKAAEIAGNIHPASNLSAFSDCSLIIEAIVENKDHKASLFKELESIVDDHCLLASNTSSLSIASLAAVCRKPERFIGIHFFNPAPVMKLVEIIPAVQTSGKSVNETLNILKAWGKTTVLAKDTPGFIVNRVARPFYGEALRIYDEGIADFATIDWAMKTFGGFPMGPFELMDFIGNDINYTVTETVFQSFFYDSRFMPSFTQKRLMEAGFLGRKSGRGYYDYSPNAYKPDPLEEETTGRQIFDRILAMLINEAADAVHYRVASAVDVDLAMTKGVNYPKGLLAWAKEIGIQTVVNQMDQLFEEYHDSRYRCSPLLRKWARTNPE